jgi:two-component system, LytTR family, response regulator LytT
MNILIVEDEDLAIDKLKATVMEVEEKAVIAGITHSIQSTVRWLETNPQPDIVLMDIELTDGLSFEIFNRTEVNCPVIFTTSYDAYAIRAFKVNSIDYLLKPVEKEDLKLALEKFHKYADRNPNIVLPALDMKSLVNDLKEQLKHNNYRDRFLVKQGQRLISLEINQLAYMVAEGRVSYIITWDKHKYIVDYTLEELETQLDPRLFFRANRSSIIHVKSIDEIHAYFNGKLKLQIHPQTQYSDIIISRERAASFKEWVGK